MVDKRKRLETRVPAENTSSERTVASFRVNKENQAAFRGEMDREGGGKARHADTAQLSPFYAGAL